MTKKIPILLLMLVLVPAFCIAWLAMRISAQSQAVDTLQYQSLITQSLTLSEQTINDYLSDLSSRMAVDIERIESLGDQVAELRAFVRSSAYINQLIVIDIAGQRIFPPRQQASQDELVFLQRTDMLWQSPERLTAPEPEQSKIFSRQILMESQRDQGDVITPHWHVWYADNGMNFILWFRYPDKRLIAVELDTARILSDLINILPETMDQDWFQKARIALLNERNEIVYQWGEYEVENKQAASAEVQSVLYLPHPLGSWQLVYYSAGQPDDRRVAYVLWLTVFLTLLGVCAVGFYLHREQKRNWQLAQQRVSFVNQVSHELKTPLTNIRMYAEMLENYLECEDSKAHDYAEVIASESQRLSRLIENVLNFSKAQNGRLSINTRPCDVDVLIHALVDTYRPLLAEKGMTLFYSSKLDIQPALDSEVVEQILINLLSNAEKYATSGDTVCITADIQDNDLFIRVIDYGPGIDERLQERIFESFYRVSSRLSDGVSGTGIGLNIARQMARLHGGDLYLENHQGAEGCIFCLRLNNVVSH